MEADNQVVVGETVDYIDPRAVRHDALVTAVHGPSCINLVYVNLDVDQRDDYGRKLVRESSVSAPGSNTAHGRYYTKKA